MTTRDFILSWLVTFALGFSLAWQAARYYYVEQYDRDSVEWRQALERCQQVAITRRR